MRTIVKTNRTVVALSLRGSEVAWLTSAEDSCALSLWLRVGGRVEQLPLPRDISSACFSLDSYDHAQLALSRTDTAWVTEDEGGNTGSITWGASSLIPRRTAELAYEITDGPGTAPATGTLVSEVAAGDAGVLWGTAVIAYRYGRGSQDSMCDLSPEDTGCETRVAGGGVHTWSSGVSGLLRGLPPVAHLAADGKLIAITPWPRGPWTKGLAPTAPTEVIGPGNRVLMRVKGSVLALSQKLLAVYDDSGGVSLYEVPSGRFLRRVSTSVSGFAVTRNRLVLWDSQRLLLVDPASGSRSTVEYFSAPPGETPPSAVTAVAVDGNRLAWAQTSTNGHSVVYSIQTG